MGARDVRKWPESRNRQFREQLLSWYGRHRRRLPWRSRPTPYRVWVAEIMLQQTRVQTVLPYYARFLRRFPDPATLAAASEEDVLAHWAGLGYYRRARDLRKAAIEIVDRRRGSFPATPEDIGRLPGVGRYTAAAIASIAFNQPHAAVDGNVRRIIRRLVGLHEAPESVVWELAESLLAKDRAREFNQAFMELGALICLPSQPRCADCPVRSLCHSGRRGRLPILREQRRLRQVPVEMLLLIVECEGRIAIARHPAGGFIPGNWGLPGRTLRTAERPLAAARRLARGILGYAPMLVRHAPVHHAITHRSILAHVYGASIGPPPPEPADRLAWVPRTSAGRLFISSLYRKALERTPADGRHPSFRAARPLPE